MPDYPQSYPNINDLDKIPIFSERGNENFEVNNLPEVLSYGKHYFLLSWKGDGLADASPINFEVKDSNGNVIFSDISDYDVINNQIICYIWIKKDPLRIYDEISDGIGKLTIVGELEHVPPQFKGKPNVRCTIPININKRIINNSPILFQDINDIQTYSSISETTGFDYNDANYKRSYIQVSASNLITYGGKVDKIELSYKENNTRSTEFKVIGIYPLSGSVYEVNSEFSAGLNPVSDIQKIPTPREIRRNKYVQFKLRFLNSNGEYAQDINKENKNVEITSSNISFGGSPLILETTDNLVTGSGALIFGSSLTNGFRIDYKPTGKGIVSDKDTLEFTRIVGGKDHKPYAIADGGEFLGDASTNVVSASVHSTIIGAISSSMTQSFGSIIVGGSSSMMSKSPLSCLLGGWKNQIDLTPYDNRWNSIDWVGHNVIIGGSQNRISSSMISGYNNVIFGGSSNLIGGNVNHLFSTDNTIIGGQYNEISGGNYNMVIGGRVNKVHGQGEASGEYTQKGTIIGGQNNTIRGGTGTYSAGAIIHSAHSTLAIPDSIILGGHHRDIKWGRGQRYTVYVPNFDVSGSMHLHEDLTVSGSITAKQYILSSSVTYMTTSFMSGSTMFGDDITDTHQFTGSVFISSSTALDVIGHITASGNISSSDTIDTKWLRIPQSADGNGGAIYFGSASSNDNNAKIYDDGGVSRGLTFAYQDTDIMSIHDEEPKVDITKNLRVGTHITASGNISSSGTLYSDKAVINTTTSAPSMDLTVHGSISASGNYHVEHANHIIFGERVVDPFTRVKIGAVSDGTFKIQGEGDGGVNNHLMSSGSSYAGIRVVIGPLSAFPETLAERLLVKGDMNVDGYITSSKYITSLGSITSSNDISASGTINASNIDFNFLQGRLYNDGGDNRLRVDDQNGNSALVIGNLDDVSDGASRVGIGNLTPNKALQVTGDISASGDLYAGSTTGAYFSASSGNVEISGSGTAELIINGTISGTSDFFVGSRTGAYISSSNGNLKLSGSLSEAQFEVDGYISSSGRIISDSHITASGDISASGTIYGTTYYSDGEILGLYHSGLMKLGTGAKPTNVRGVSITLEAPLTSSYNISSSGWLSGSSIHASGDVYSGTKTLVKNYGNGSNSELAYWSGADSVQGNQNLSYVNNALKVGAFSGHVAISASGHINENHGDGGNISGSLTPKLGKGYGKVIGIGNSDTVEGSVYCLQSTSTWEKITADGGCVSSSLLGVALGTNSSEGMLLNGFAQISQSGTTAIGQKVYVSKTSGCVSGSIDDLESGDVVRVLGYVLNSGNNNGSGSIYFNPDNTWLEIV